MEDLPKIGFEILILQFFWKFLWQTLDSATFGGLCHELPKNKMVFFVYCFRDPKLSSLRSLLTVYLSAPNISGQNNLIFKSVLIIILMFVTFWFNRTNHKLKRSWKREIQNPTQVGTVIIYLLLFAKHLTCCPRKINTNQRPVNHISPVKSRIPGVTNNSVIE